MKKYLSIALLLALTLTLTSPLSFAESGGYHDKSLDEKFFMKVKKIYLYQDEIGVSDEQLDQLTELKVELKKDLIQKKADIDIIKVDIHSLLYADEIDTEAINKLIDRKYDIKKTKSKRIVAAIASLKKILTKEQMEKLKDIMHNHKKGHMPKGSHMEFGKGSMK